MNKTIWFKPVFVVLCFMLFSCNIDSNTRQVISAKDAVFPFGDRAFLSSYLNTKDMKAQLEKDDLYRHLTKEETAWLSKNKIPTPFNILNFEKIGHCYHVSVLKPNSKPQSFAYVIFEKLDKEYYIASKNSDGCYKKDESADTTVYFVKITDIDLYLVSRNTSNFDFRGMKKSLIDSRQNFMFNSWEESLNFVDKFFLDINSNSISNTKAYKKYFKEFYNNSVNDLILGKTNDQSEKYRKLVDDLKKRKRNHNILIAQKEERLQKRKQRELLQAQLERKRIQQKNECFSNAKSRIASCWTTMDGLCDSVGCDYKYTCDSGYKGRSCERYHDHAEAYYDDIYCDTQNPKNWSSNINEVIN